MKESRIEKKLKIKSRIPRPINGVIALGKNKGVVKKPITQGNSKIPRLITRKIFKDEPSKKINSKLNRKRSTEPLDSKVQPKENKPNRGVKRKKDDDLKGHSKKRKTFESWI